MKKIVFTTGGTGGHIYPALAIAKKIKEKNKNTEILFIGTEHRMERELVPTEGFKFIGLDVIPLKTPISVIKMLSAINKTIKIFKEEKPTEIIGFGNYITLPVLIAARILKIPYYLQEQNCTMGMANRYFYKKAKKVFIAFENTLNTIDEKYKNKFLVTGNPLREEFFEKEKSKERKLLNIKDNEKVIMIIGGSLGAKNINEALIKKWNEIIKDEKIKIFWATGKNNYTETINKIRKKGNSVIEPYFDNAADIMSAADIVICRAGASTISELIQLEKPSILIPYNFVGQEENSDILEYISAAKVYSNEKIDEAIEEALTLVNQKDMLEYMQNNIKELNRGNASEIIVKEMNL